MVGIEKDILILISRVRCMTETQAGKVFNTKKKHGRKPFKRVLRKMCNEYTLRKYPCNINYCGYRDNSYVYYLNGSKLYNGKDLLKVLIGSELAIKIETGGYQLKRFYRNVNVGNNKYDIFIEYADKYNDLKQILIDVEVDNKVNMSKYDNLSNDIEKCTIPFYELPKVLIVSSSRNDKLFLKKINDNVNFVDINLTKLFNYI